MSCCEAQKKREGRTSVPSCCRTHRVFLLCPLLHWSTVVAMRGGREWAKKSEGFFWLVPYVILERNVGSHRQIPFFCKIGIGMPNTPLHPRAIWALKWVLAYRSTNRINLRVQMKELNLAPGGKMYLCPYPSPKRWLEGDTTIHHWFFLFVPRGKEERPSSSSLTPNQPTSQPLPDFLLLFLLRGLSFCFFFFFPRLSSGEEEETELFFPAFLLS